MPRATFSRSTYADMVAGALRDWLQNPKIHRSPRNDIWAVVGGGGEAAAAKVSGSAYKVVRDRALHHGTLLFDANLSLLHHLLRPTPGLAFITDPTGELQRTITAVTSVPSPTANLQGPGGRRMIDQATLTRILLDGFTRFHRLTAADLAMDIFTDQMIRDDQSLLQNFRELQDEAGWIYGKTPPFFIQIQENSMPSNVEAFGWARISDGLSIDQSSDANLVGKRLDEHLN